MEFGAFEAVGGGQGGQARVLHRDGSGEQGGCHRPRNAGKAREYGRNLSQIPRRAETRPLRAEIMIDSGTITAAAVSLKRDSCPLMKRGKEVAQTPPRRRR